MTGIYFYDYAIFSILFVFVPTLIAVAIARALKGIK